MISENAIDGSSVQRTKNAGLARWIGREEVTKIPFGDMKSLSVVVETGFDFLR